MDLFTRALFVRLRCHKDKYLIASDDEESIFQNRFAATRAARWEVEIVEPSNPPLPPAVRLKSFYGHYLSASDDPFFLGLTGRKVVQAAPGHGGLLDSSMEWEPIREGDQASCRLRTRGGHFLRANRGLPPWRNSVTHDVVPNRTATLSWVLWHVEIVDVRVISSGSVSTASGEIKSEEESPASSHSAPAAPLHGRTIHYVVATDKGEVNTPFSPLAFTGSTVEDLMTRLRQETGYKHIAVCTRNPLNGDLFPLHLRLPAPADSPLLVVVVPYIHKPACSCSDLSSIPTAGDKLCGKWVDIADSDAAPADMRTTRDESPAQV